MNGCLTFVHLSVAQLPGEADNNLFHNNLLQMLLLSPTATIFPSARTSVAS